MRKVRRSLTVDQAYRLLSVCGPRRMFYSMALWSGLRMAELGALRWGDLHLDGDRPAIRLRPETTKNRQGSELPLRADLAVMLQDAKGPFAKADRPAVQGRTDAADVQGWLGPQTEGQEAISLHRQPGTRRDTLCGRSGPHGGPSRLEDDVHIVAGALRCRSTCSSHTCTARTPKYHLETLPGLQPIRPVGRDSQAATDPVGWRAGGNRASNGDR